MGTSHHVLDMNCTGVASTVTLDEQGVRYLFVHQLRAFQLRQHFRFPEQVSQLSPSWLANQSLSRLASSIRTAGSLRVRPNSRRWLG
jgi:hypothetical protein